MSNRHAVTDRTAGEPRISDIVGYLQEVLGQKLVAYIAEVDDPNTAAGWAAGRLAPRTEQEQRLRCAYQAFQLLVAREGFSTSRAWFLGLNPTLDDESPARQIRNGAFRAVLIAAEEFVTAE